MSSQTVLWRCENCSSGNDFMDVTAVGNRKWKVFKLKLQLIARCRDCGANMELIGVC